MKFWAERYVKWLIKTKVMKDKEIRTNIFIKTSKRFSMAAKIDSREFFAYLTDEVFEPTGTAWWHLKDEFKSSTA